MKYFASIYCLGSLCLASLLAGCTDEQAAPTASVRDANEMVFDVRYPAVSAPSSRVTDDHFDADDRVGVYVTQAGVPLELAGNYVNNELLTYAVDGVWQPARPIYWNEGTYDIFAYCPYTSPVASVNDFPFAVSTDQTTAGDARTPGGFEASDFLFARSAGQKAGNEPVALQFRHIMSKLVVRLVKGEDFEGDLPEDAQVLIHNTVPSATIDLSVGIATKYAYGTEQTIQAKSLGGHKYAAILVPQRLANRRPLIEVIMRGVSYLVESTFVFKPGIQHTVSVVIDKNPEQVKIDIGGEIEDWEQA